MVERSTTTESGVVSGKKGATNARPPSRARAFAMNDQRPRASTGKVQPHTTLGQFAFAPATQTTIVTTTTTTTTKFPPFVMRPPRQAGNLDPRQYPLAATPTPAGLKNIAFTLDGHVTRFTEAEDVNQALEELREEREILNNSNGFLQHMGTYEQPVEGLADTGRQLSYPFTFKVKSYQSTPYPDPDGNVEPNEPRFKKRRTSADSINNKIVPRSGMRSHPRFNEIRLEDPITPDSARRETRSSRRRSQRQSALSTTTDNVLPSPTTEQHITVAPNRGAQSQELGLQANGVSLRNNLMDSSYATSQRVEDHNVAGSPNESVVPTPPVEPEDHSSLIGASGRRALSSIPSRLYVGESPGGQDGSLPSPSLSPVTAAATAQTGGYFGDVDSDPDFNSDVPYLEGAPENGYESPETSVCDVDMTDSVSQYRFAAGSVDEIPAMLDYFEAIPDELKGYVMHQLLRRCPKPTLQTVADIVNPALKCDFLTMLPIELSLNIMNHLDLRSLAKASQVSRKWREMVNTNEQGWKELFDGEGFVLTEGELERSIAEGWGWQDPYGIDGYERDLSHGHQLRSDTEMSASSPSSLKPKKGVARRSKRKAATLLSNRNKQPKRKDSSREPSVDLEAIMKTLAEAKGPRDAAQAAVQAVSQPKLAIPSLKNMHLYKSLYRRHHLIRRNWMFEETKPRHIAFRAHDSHVVTCLQFDTNKILTGSDDNNINVYETQTGRLRAKLKGHEGGVWALQYDGNTLVSGSTDRSVRVWDIERGEETHVFRGHTSTVRCLQIVQPVKVGQYADGRAITMPKQPLIITGSRDSTLRVWRLPKADDPHFYQTETDGDPDDCPYFLRTLTGHGSSVRAIAAYADTLVSGSYDHTVRVWKISTGETMHRLEGHTQKVYSVVLDHARNRCISGSMDNLVKIWSLDHGSVLYTLEGHTSLVGLLDLNCDRLVSAAADSTLRIWDPEKGQCKATLTAHTGAITCFQHDGQKVISGSDRTLKLWDIKTGDCIKDLLSDLSGVWQVKFNDRRCVAAVQRDSMTYIEVLDFGAARDGIPENRRGRRIEVDSEGNEMISEDAYLELDGGMTT